MKDMRMKMIRLNQLKLPVDHTREQLIHKTAQYLRIPAADILELQIVRQSLDARKKPALFYSYSVNVTVKKEEKVYKDACRRLGKANVLLTEKTEYLFPAEGSTQQKHPTVIIGMGPAGLFCGYYLAQHGYAPVILERGADVNARQADVEAFWQTGRLKPDSNVQFGEGGAGTFSDGKLNTLVKDKYGRNTEVLKTFVKHGADPAILYQAKPHIGTDVLSKVVKSMREEILRMGGEVRFHSQMTEILTENGQVTGVKVNDTEVLPCEQVVLAPGHSARDTFSMLYRKQFPMSAKPFAVGFRVEHPQSLINMSQYGAESVKGLGAAAYKVTAKTSTGRGVYSFCMCPGGYVVNASSEPGRLAVNGMSYSGRDGKNANSAIIVAVTPADYGSDHPLAGIEFQRGLEQRAYELCDGKLPVQRYGDFREKVTGEHPAETDGVQRSGPEALEPQCKGAYEWADLTGILPAECNRAFVEGMDSFDRQIHGFASPGTILTGVESRTSSPVRIERDEELQSAIRGCYPCGEGAGYAGGITSAAMDGIRVAEQIASQFAPLQR